MINMCLCQACGKPCDDQFSCPGCKALMFCSAKHRSAHQRHGGHDQHECSRMAKQLTKSKTLELSWFPWWSELHTHLTAPSPKTSSVPSTGPSRLVALAAAAGLRDDHGRHTWVTPAMLTACWHAHQHTPGPAWSHENTAYTADALPWRVGCVVPWPICTENGQPLQPIEKHQIGSVWSSTGINNETQQQQQQQQQQQHEQWRQEEQQQQQQQHHHHRHQQQQERQQQEQQQEQTSLAAVQEPTLLTPASDVITPSNAHALSDWPFIYTALRLPPRDPSALALHFAASLAHALQASTSYLQPLSLTPLPFAYHHAKASTPGHPHTGFIDSQATEVTKRYIAQEIQSQHIVDGAPTGVARALHVFYLGPEVECQLLETFQSLHVLLQPFMAAMPSHEHMRGVANVDTTMQVWLHFVGPAVPQAWHGLSGTFTRPDIKAWPKDCQAGVCQFELHASFWHGCLHEVSVELAAWLRQHCYQEQPAAHCDAQHVKHHKPASCVYGRASETRGDMQTPNDQLHHLHDGEQQPAQQPQWQQQERLCSAVANSDRPLPVEFQHYSQDQSGLIHSNSIRLNQEETSTCCASHDSPAQQRHTAKRRRCRYGLTGIPSPDRDPPATCPHCQGSSCLWACLGEAPALVWAPNAGLVAYPSWSPTLHLLASCRRAPPLFTTDYCEEALVRAQVMMESLYPELQCVLPPQPNPLRQPWKQEVHGNALPSFSNGFVAGWARWPNDTTDLASQD